MTMPKRERAIRIAILQSLAECGDYLIPEDVLALQVQLRARPHDPPLSEIKQALRALDADGALVIVSEHDEFKLGANAKGRADLARMLS